MTKWEITFHLEVHYNLTELPAIITAYDTSKKYIEDLMWIESSSA
jgi:hypothetical protein